MPTAMQKRSPLPVAAARMTAPADIFSAIVPFITIGAEIDVRMAMGMLVRA